ncbi:hypothetical protein ACGFIJ_06170 [Microbispora bryophytorum]|uniref:hypothetical protein n=1 Tax=Microbispora bryophytorum TaxID=1460882 RepID=UPI00371F537C
MGGRLLLAEGDHRHAEAAADDLGEGPQRYALLGGRVQDGTGLGRLQGLAVEPGGVEAVHGRPAVGAVACVGGDGDRRQA